MKKIALLFMTLLLGLHISCKDTSQIKEEEEAMEKSIKKMDSLEMELEKVKRDMKTISEEADRTVNEIN